MLSQVLIFSEPFGHKQFFSRIEAAILVLEPVDVTVFIHCYRNGKNGKWQYKAVIKFETGTSIDN